MKVLKFGGTSVGSAQRIKNVASIVCDQEQKMIDATFLIRWACYFQSHIVVIIVLTA